MPELLEYWYSETQLGVITPSSLLGSVVAYGDGGVVKGDGSIYNNLDPNNIQETYIPNDLFGSSENINYSDFISNPKTDQCGLYGIEFTLDNTKIKTIEDFINNATIINNATTMNETIYTDKRFINNDNTILSLVKDGNAAIKLITCYKNYNIYYVRVLENDTKIGKILIADNDNNVIDMTNYFTTVATELPHILCYAADETHYNVIICGYNSSTSQYTLCAFKIDFSLPVESWLSYINETTNTLTSSTAYMSTSRNNGIFGRWAILTQDNAITCYDFDTNNLFTVYSNSTSYKVYHGVNYVKDDILYYNSCRTQFAYDLANKTMLSDASETYVTYTGGEFGVQLTDTAIHICYNNKYQWNWNFSTHIKTNETKTIANNYPKWDKLSYGSPFTTITSPYTGKPVPINDTYEILQNNDYGIFVHDKTTDTWTKYNYFKYLFGEIRYYNYDNTVKYYVHAQINNNNPQKLVWLYYQIQDDGMGGSFTNFYTKTIKDYKAYNPQPLNIPVMITEAEYNTALATSEDILGITTE